MRLTIGFQVRYRKLGLLEDSPGVPSFQCKIMVFDEPTATMDPHSQREVWELLLKARRHCCILLTTQNLHEADVLADKIGIMNKGLLWCCGSPDFLRERFRAGYSIRITKEPGCDAAAIEALLRRHVPHAVLKQDSNFEVQYAVGVNPGSRRLTAMFKELDRERENLKIGAMSVAMSSLEEVLDKVTHDPSFHTGVDTETPRLSDQNYVYKPLSGPGRRTCPRQLAWLLKKRFYVWLRDWHPPVVRWVVPMCVLLMATYLQHLFIEDEIVSADFYKDRLLYSVRHLHVPAQGFIAANSSTDPVVRHLVKLFAEEEVHLVDIGAEHTNTRLLEYAVEYPRSYNYRMLFGTVLVENATPVLWFNGQCPHAAPLIVNLYHSAILRNITRRPTARFLLYNHPYSNETAAERHSSGDTGDSEKQDLQVLLQSKIFFAGIPLSADTLLVEVLMGIFTPLALCFHAASFVVYPLAERRSKFKHLQMMTGVSGAVYWLSNFIFDTLMAASCAVIFVPIICFSHRYFHKAEYIAMLVLLFVAHGISMVPFCYVASTLFRDSSFALSMMVMFLFFVGLVGALETVIVHFTQTVAEARLLSLVPQALDILLRSVPTFTLTRGISQLQRLQYENQICQATEEILAIACKSVELEHTISLKHCCSVLPSRNVNDTTEDTRRAMVKPFELSSVVMTDVFVMLAEAVVLLAFVVVMDATAYAKIRRKLHGTFHRSENRSSSPECQEGPRLATSPLDSDVGHEAEVVEKLGSGPIPPEFALVVSKLTKSFGLSHGVNNVSFTLKTGQCLGIIGVTGAGKTELMQLLTGLSESSSGDVYLGSLSRSRTPREYASKIGYCPDALGLPDHLTGREIIELFCVLRGFRLNDTAAIVNNLLGIMELTTVANDLTNNYTPGDKRKLCIALAIAGLPSVVLLDEPSTGVDVASKAQIRRSLSIVRRMTDCAILLTSNSMQQCEVLCDRIAIMLSGQLECIGTVDELKSKFGRGYTITIKMRQDTIDDSEYREDLTQDMKAEFHSCQLDHSFQGVLEYRIATTYTTWSEMFSKMAVIQKKYRFKEFYVCDTTLEQIFVSYARKQINFTKALASTS